MDCRAVMSWAEASTGSVGPVRQSAVAAGTLHGQHEPVRRGHDGPCHGPERADGKAGPAVQREGRIGAGLDVEKPLLDHQPAPALLLLGRLEHEAHAAGKMCRKAVKDPRGAEEHGHMPIVTAGMRDAFPAGVPGPAGSVGKRQGADVRAQQDGAPRSPSPQQGHRVRLDQGRENLSPGA